jgi:hypothetical protein
MGKRQVAGKMAELAEKLTRGTAYIPLSPPIQKETGLLQLKLEEAGP